MAKVFRASGIEPGERLYLLGYTIGIASIIAGGTIWLYGRESLFPADMLPFTSSMWVGAGLLMVILFRLGYRIRPFTKDPEGQVERFLSQLPNSYYVIKDFELIGRKPTGGHSQGHEKGEERIALDYITIGPPGIFILKLLKDQKVVEVARSRREWKRKKINSGNEEKKDICSLTHECMRSTRALRDLLIEYRYNILPSAPQKLETIKIEPIIVIIAADREGGLERRGDKGLAVPVLTLEECRERILRGEPTLPLSPGESLNLSYSLRRWAFP